MEAATGSTICRHIEVTPIHPVIGARVTGIDLSAGTGVDALREIRAALMAHCVIFFPGQDLAPARQVAFARHFGEVPPCPDAYFQMHPDDPHVSVLVNDEARPPTVNNWHSDNSQNATPDFASVLYAREIPEVGGDTIWVNMYAVYEALPAEIRATIDSLQAIHDFMNLYSRPVKSRLWEGERAARMERERRNSPPVAHPMVRTHPETGRRALFVNESFTSHIVGMERRASRAMLDYLFEVIRTPEHQIRYGWTAGDVAMWDNRCTVHYAVADYWPRRRVMHRVSVLNGEVPR